MVSERNAGSEPGEATPDHRPTDFVAGVIDHRDEFDAAIRDLVDAGFAESTLGVRYGQAGIDAFVARPHSWLAELLSDQSAYIDRYTEELRRGGHAIRVPLTGPRPRDELKVLVRQILRRHSAHHIVVAGRWSFGTDPDFQPIR